MAPGPPTRLALPREGGGGGRFPPSKGPQAGSFPGGCVAVGPADFFNLHPRHGYGIYVTPSGGPAGAGAGPGRQEKGGPAPPRHRRGPRGYGRAITFKNPLLCP